VGPCGVSDTHHKLFLLYGLVSVAGVLLLARSDQEIIVTCVRFPWLNNFSTATTKG
jgi:hypothetical protein